MHGEAQMPIVDVIGRIVVLNRGLRDFWGNAHGWAPLEAAQLLSKSRLDWQVSLSLCLAIWSLEPSTDAAAGHLILGWANLGSLVEGTMKLFLSVWYDTYRQDADAIRRGGELQEPDTMQFELLRQFLRRKVWGDPWDSWLQQVQQRRNAIHAFRDRDIGSREEFLAAVRKYLVFLRYVNDRLPYPDDMYKPREDWYPPSDEVVF